MASLGNVVPHLHWHIIPRFESDSRLHWHPALEPLAKLLRSAVANAEQAAKDQSLDVDRLLVKELMVDQGPSLRRYMPRAMGRAFKILKKTSHIQLTLSDETLEKRASRATGGVRKTQSTTKKRS